ncbi:hypothetical protein Syun_002096 [Stephania yunnanensis]|uniref:Uncharacterized protein n=1 Tax=Stephania yunnanensis TaxID=152371 RepID=A0AAP0LF60_9MAGN
MAGSVLEHTTVLVDEMMSLGSNLMDVNVALIKEHMAGSVLEHTAVLMDEMMSLGSNLMDVNVALIKSVRLNLRQKTTQDGSIYLLREQLLLDLSRDTHFKVDSLMRVIEFATQ